jgi:hypothetical protein
MLNVILLSDIMLNVILLNGILVSDVMLNVLIQNVAITVRLDLVTS